MKNQNLEFLHSATGVKVAGAMLLLQDLQLPIGTFAELSQTMKVVQAMLTMRSLSFSPEIKQALEGFKMQDQKMKGELADVMKPLNLNISEAFNCFGLSSEFKVGIENLEKLSQKMMKVAAQAYTSSPMYKEVERLIEQGYERDEALKLAMKRIGQPVSPGTRRAFGGIMPPLAVPSSPFLHLSLHRARLDELNRRVSFAYDDNEDKEDDYPASEPIGFKQRNVKR